MVINTHVIVVMRRRPSPARAGHLASGTAKRTHCREEAAAGMPSRRRCRHAKPGDAAVDRCLQGRPGPARPRPRWMSAAPASPPQAAPPGPMGLGWRACL